MKHSTAFSRISVGVVFGLFAGALSAAPELILHNGPVITLDAADTVADAIAVEEGRIRAVGSAESVMALGNESTRVVDLKGRPLLPGFVDSHSHASGIGLQAMSANLLPAPDGQGNSIADLQRILRDYLSGEPELLAGTGWLVGFGYDDSQLTEKRHPTRHDLDAVSSEQPILIVHQSGHLGVVNTAALLALGLDASTPDPAGGVFRREGDDGKLNGVAEEMAFFMMLFPLMGTFSDELSDDMVLAGLESMARFGYTTAQDGRSSAANLASFERLAASGQIPIDLVAFPDILTVEDIAPQHDYRNRYRVGGVKLSTDGSPQGKTAFLSHPYHVPPQGQGEDYRGYPAVPAETVNASVERAFANSWQILVHANGDAAIDGFIDAIRLARSAHPNAEVRPVLIHGQTLRFDQVAALDELGIFPSLFPMHTFYWGDWHRESVLGPERAENISPTGWLRERDMIFGSHHDAPVALPDSMRVLSATVTRETRSGYVLGPEHRVDVMTGLRALSTWPAWQHFEEDDKGSLEVGKLADLVILSADPLSVDPKELADLQVLATLKEGSVVYTSEVLADELFAAQGE